MNMVCEGPEICEICGNDVDSCICPPCKECGVIGDPKCYVLHGMIISLEQEENLAYNKRAWARADEDFYFEY